MESTTQDTAQPANLLPVNSRFTSENARLMAGKAVEARRKKAEERKLAALAPGQVAGHASVEADEYILERITSARAQVKRLEGLASACSDPLDSERFARAAGTWHEIERVLSNRPLPGSRKPVAEKGKRAENIIPL